jgi:hypothetical protein
MSEPFVVHLPETRTLLVGFLKAMPRQAAIETPSGGSRLSGQWKSHES